MHDVNRLEEIMMSLEYILNNQRKRHIMGGTLLSASLLFAGLAFAILSLKLVKGESDEEQFIE